MKSIAKQELLSSTSRQVVSLSGISYDTTIGKDLIIDLANVGNIKLYLAWIINSNLKLHNPLFRILTDLLSTHSERYSSTCSRSAKSAHDSSDLFSNYPITLNDIMSFLQSESPNSYQAFVLPVLRRLKEFNYELFDKQAVSFLESSFKYEKKNGSYFRLMTNCPESGALTEQELHNIHSALNHSYANGEINQTDFTLMWMCIGTGLRPIQIARMKRKDVTIHNGSEGQEVMLQVSLAKGEGTNNNEYWLRRAPSVLSEALINYLKSTKTTASEYLFFEKSGTITDRVRTTGQKLNTWSERLGAKIPITPYRFRYTLATRALAHGATDWEVARLMTHRSTSCIQYYRASMPEMLNPIKSAIGKEIAYFARAFQGRLINDLSEATRKDEGEAEIMDFIHLTTGASIGACGTRALCYQNAPIACLSCPRFEPYKEAPWEKLLNSIQADAELESEERIKTINLNAISAIQGIMSRRDREAVDE